jgi:hypothetical protein
MNLMLGLESLLTATMWFMLSRWTAGLSKLVLVDRLAWQSATCARQLSGLLAGITMLSNIIALLLRESRQSLEERWVFLLQVVQYLDCCYV